MHRAQDKWRKSSYSQQETACVEVTLAPTQARVRDTKDRQAGHLEVAGDAWSAFLTSVRH
nr:DUF397 domain-containing protein [Amycolatopsis palatopharyngis]